MTICYALKCLSTYFYTKLIYTFAFKYIKYLFYMHNELLRLLLKCMSFTLLMDFFIYTSNEVKSNEYSYKYYSSYVNCFPISDLFGL